MENQTLHEDVRELKKLFVDHAVKQDEIYVALVGNPKYKIKGIVDDVADLKTDKEKRGKRNLIIFGASVGGALGLQKLFTVLTEFFK